eukprot:TRINITY_DN366_c0_g1_i1.p2 TRINITY_DN366_c0_g1~~TRINITY_DN366_c0_g1_i1.p2  ORF type:complete len:109 (+),score=5.04 TRINITY_DN366_c0_g1_i1:2794-3120(+)
MRSNYWYVSAWISNLSPTFLKKDIASVWAFVHMSNLATRVERKCKDLCPLDIAILLNAYASFPNYERVGNRKRLLSHLAEKTLLGRLSEFQPWHIKEIRLGLHNQALL